MKNRLYYTILVFSSVVLLGGCTAFNQRIAENYYEEYAYSRAIPNYEKVLRRTFDPDAASKLADSYRKTGNSLKAEIWYKRLANAQLISLKDKLNFAEVLMENGKYEEAKVWFKDYLLLNTFDNRVSRLIEACDSIHVFFEDTTIYNITFSKLNKGFESNFSPTYFKNGIVFLSDRSAPGKNRDRSSWTGKEYLDLFYSYKMGEENWQEPVILKGDINGRFDEGPAVFSSDFTEIYFTRTDYTGKVVEKNLKNISTLKLYQGKLINNQWEMQSLLHFNNKDYSVGHPALSADGLTLFFVSDMPWGYGGTDIYKVTKQNGLWSEPENLGANINTEGDEMFPFISADSILYFASDGYVGLGGLDIYSSYKDNGEWSIPENLQYPVNSSKDDFGFIISDQNTSGYFSSNRIKNTDMIFEFKKNPPVFGYELSVTDQKTNKPIKNFEVSSISKTGEIKPAGNGVDGKYSIKLKQNNDYAILIKSFGFAAIQTEFSTKGKRKSDIISHNLTLSKIEVEKSKVWPMIEFKKKDVVFAEGTTKALDSLYNILQLNPEMQIEIASHTDSRGSYTDNMNLSKKRAEAVVAYLMMKGIKQSKVLPVGFGEGKLLNNCRDGILCLEEDHQVNDRIEIKVIGLIKD